MNSKERVVAALRRQEPDRVPLGEFGVDHDIVERVIGRRTFWRSKNLAMLAFWSGLRDKVVESLKRDLVALVEALDYDMVPVHLVPPRGYRPGLPQRTADEAYVDGHGQVWRYSAGNDSLLLLERPLREIKSEADLVSFFETELVPRSGFRIAGQDGSRYRLELADRSCLELAEFIVQRFGGNRFVFARSFEEGAGGPEPSYLSEWEVASVFFGGRMEDFYIEIATRPGLVRRAFDLATELQLAMAREFIQVGVDAVITGGDFASSSGPLISPASVRSLFLPGMKTLVDYVHSLGAFALTHNCGNNWMLLDLLVEAGYDAWQSIQCKTADMDLKRLKAQYGDRISFWGGINIETLQQGTPQENRTDVTYALREAGPGGGLILGCSNSVAYGSIYENYLAALDTARHSGTYPLCL
jgi:hypothetical protein